MHVDAIRDDLETLVLDADLLEAVLGTPDPNKKAKEIEIKVARWLRKRLHDPRFKELSERLEALKEKHEQGLLLSIDFLKALLDLARDVVAAEQAAEPIGDEELGKAALTELFEEAKNEKTPIMVERVVNDIDEIVRYVPLRRLAEHPRRRARGQDGSPQDAVQVQAPPGSGAVRPSIRVHPDVLLTFHLQLHSHCLALPPIQERKLSVRLTLGLCQPKDSFVWSWVEPLLV